MRRLSDGALGRRGEAEALGPRKPLYLRNSPGLRVVLDGAALCVRQVAKAVMRFPLARLARVVNSGEVDWDCAALLGCAEAGVPVVFLHRDGTVRGYLFGRDARSRDQHDLLYTRLRARLTRAGGMARYEQWRQAMLREAAVEGQLGAALAQRATTDAARRMRRRAVAPEEALAERVAVRFKRRLRGLLSGLAGELLAEAGLDARRWSRLDVGVDLPGDLGEVMGQALEAPILRAMRVGAATGVELDDAALTALFEAQTPRLWQLGLAAVKRLREMLET